MLDQEIKKKRKRTVLSPEEEKVQVEIKQKEILAKIEELGDGLEGLDEEKKAVIQELLKNGDSEQLQEILEMLDHEVWEKERKVDN